MAFGRQLVWVGYGIVLLLACSCAERGHSEGEGRCGAAYARMRAPHGYLYYDEDTRSRELHLADRMKMWGDEGVILPWQSVAESIVRGKWDDKDGYGCATVFWGLRLCPSCQERAVVLYYGDTRRGVKGREGWLSACITCRRQFGYKRIKQ